MIAEPAKNNKTGENRLCFGDGTNYFTLLTMY